MWPDFHILFIYLQASPTLFSSIYAQVGAIQQSNFPSFVAMFRALSTRRSGYERLVDESSIGLLEVKLSRSVTLPAKLFGSRRKMAPEGNLVPGSAQKQAKKATKIPEKSEDKQVKKASKIHPIFSIFEKRRRKKATSKPEFARYLEYVKEGGLWDVNSNVPVMHYK